MDLIFEPNIGNTNFCIEVGYFDTVLQIKEKIQKYQGISVSNQTLVFNGHTLNDEMNIHHSEILDRSRVQLLVATPAATNSGLSNEDSMIRKLGGIESFLPSSTASPPYIRTALISQPILDDHINMPNLENTAPSPSILDDQIDMPDFGDSATSQPILDDHISTPDFGNSTPSPLILDDHVDKPDSGNSTRSPLILDDHIINKTNFGYSAPSPQILDHHTNVSNFGYSTPSPPILDHTNVVSNFGKSASSTSSLQSLSADPAAFGFHPSSGNATPLTPPLQSLSADPGFGFRPNFGNAAPFTRPVPSLSSAYPGLEFRPSTPLTSPLSSLSAYPTFGFRPNFGNPAPLSPFTSSLPAYPSSTFMPSFGNLAPLTPSLPSLSAVPGFADNSGNSLPLTPPLPSLSAAKHSWSGSKPLYGRTAPFGVNSGAKAKLSSPSKIKLLVKMHAPKLDIALDANETIASLKEKIHKMEEIPVNRLFIIANGVHLRDHKSLRECKLTDNSEIDVVIIHPSFAPSSSGLPPSFAPSSSGLPPSPAPSSTGFPPSPAPSSTGLPPSPTPSSSILPSSRKNGGSKKLIIIVVMQRGSRRFSLEVDYMDTPEDLRTMLEQSKFDIPKEYFFVYEQEVMKDDGSFRWHGVRQRGKIELITGIGSRGS